MRILIAIVFGLGIGTIVFYFQNPDVVFDALQNLTDLSSQSLSTEEALDSFVSMTAISTSKPTSGTDSRTILRGSSKPDKVVKSADIVSDLEQKVHTGINAARAKNGVSPKLRWVDQLGAVARTHSEDMTKRRYFDHDNPEGLGPSERINKAGYNCWKESHYGVAENITIQLVSGSVDIMADGAVQSWLNSPGHRTNLLGKQYDRTGVGVSFGIWRGHEAVYVTQVFC